MSEQTSEPTAAPKKVWYLKWWIWLIAAVLVAGGISAIVNPSGDGGSPPSVAQPGTTADASESPDRVAPLDLEAFLSESGVAFDSVSLSAGKAYIYVPTGTTNEQAQQIASDAMLYICDHAVQAGESAPVANRVEVSDGVSPLSPGYDAAEHPSGFATAETCEG